MELKEFIVQTITDITEAINDLQLNLKNGTIINPTITKENFDKLIFIDNDARMLEQIEFDIAVTLSEESTAQGQIGGGIKVVSGRYGKGRGSKLENISRLSFSIPVAYPAVKVKTPGELLLDEIQMKTRNANPRNK